ncbi:MAG: hypothetical protein NWE79_08740, partial [Candidatus Bathyarchaeota archaeon]|nr:hypothetical protein [Candidatus Bathyarchaeota archaeon]
MSREGKAGPSEAGRGKYSPPANPERVTAGASERRGAGVLLPRSKKGKIFKDYENTRCESPETPVKQIVRKDIFTPIKKGEHVVNMVKKYL